MKIDVSSREGRGYGSGGSTGTMRFGTSTEWKWLGWVHTNKLFLSWATGAVRDTSLLLSVRSKKKHTVLFGSLPTNKQSVSFFRGVKREGQQTRRHFLRKRNGKEKLRKHSIPKRNCLCLCQTNGGGLWNVETIFI